MVIPIDSKRVNRAFERYFSHLFFIFFVAQILSPAFGGISIYLELPLAVLNPYFLFWVFKNVKGYRLVWFALGVSILAFFLDIMAVIKILTLAITVCFLFYSYDRRIFYLKNYLIISIGIAILQLVLIFIDLQLAIAIGPENISKVIWGSYAIETFSNFYTIFFIPRVSGLSREAGFFASLVSIAIIFYFFQQGLDSEYRAGWIFKILLLLGFILSFSKISLVIIPLYLIALYKKVIDYLPCTLTLVVFVFVLNRFWTYNDYYLLNWENESFSQRFLAYPILNDLTLYQWLIGVQDFYEISSKYTYFILNDRFYGFAGFAGFILTNGILFVAVFIFFFRLLGVSTSGVIFMLLATLNVDLLTNQNFVSLAYFVVISNFTNSRFVVNNLEWKRNLKSM